MKKILDKKTWLRNLLQKEKERNYSEKVEKLKQRKQKIHTKKRTYAYTLQNKHTENNHTHNYHPQRKPYDKKKYQNTYYYTCTYPYNRWNDQNIHEHTQTTPYKVKINEPTYITHERIVQLS